MLKAAVVVRTIAIVGFGWLASAVTCAQTAAMQLPAELNGRYSYNGKGNAWSLTIDQRGSDGSFEGKVTYPGRLCFAKNLPVKAAVLMNDELRFTVDMDGCPDMQFVMKKSSGHRFQGEARNPGAPTAGAVDVYLD